MRQHWPSSTLLASYLRSFFFFNALLLIQLPLEAFGVPQPKIGLALAGGGALGFAHVGVLKVLHEARVPVHMVAGTSMGSIVGAAFASGATLEEIEHTITSTDWDNLFKDGPRRENLPLREKTGRNREILGDAKFGIANGSLVLPAGILQGQRIRPVLQQLYHRYPVAGSFDSLAVPYRAVAADIETGKAVILDEGDISLAARASMAVPGVFAPVDLGGKLLVDGGIANNLPIDVVQNMGASIVIAVELYADLQKRDSLSNPLAISSQMLSLLLAQNSERQRQRLAATDILIEPELTGFSATSFNKAAELVARGEAAARNKIHMLQRLSLSEEEYARYVSTRTEIPERPSTIQFVRVKNESAFPDPVLEQRITVSAGDSFSAESIGESVESLYNLGPFSSVSTERVEENGKSGLVIRATEKPWYDQYMRVGLGLEEDFEGESFYNLAVALRRNDVGFNGGFGDLKLRLGHINALVGEFSDPFISGSDFYYSAEGLIDRRSVFFRGNESEEIVADYRRSREQLTLSTGYGFYQTYTAKAGIRYGAGEIKRRIGSSDLPNVSFDIGDAFTSLVYDSQDDADFPEYGTLAKFTVTRSLEALGSSADFTELGGELVQPISFGSTRLLYRGEFAVTDGNRPAGRVHTLGGFLDLSGYTQSSLAATSFHIHRLTLLEALDQSTALLGYTLFGGASFEISSLTSSLPGINDRGVLSSGSVFVGANTPLLPVYLGVGMAEAGNTSLYLVIGRITSPAQRFDGG